MNGGGSVDQSLVKVVISVADSHDGAPPGRPRWRTSAVTAAKNTSSKRIDERCAEPKSTGSTTTVPTSERCTTTRSLPRRPPVLRQTRRSGGYCPGLAGSKLRHPRRCPPFLPASHTGGSAWQFTLACAEVNSKWSSGALIRGVTAMPQDWTPAAAPVSHQSMPRTGSALDNAVSESFNSTLQFELFEQKRCSDTDDLAATALVDLLFAVCYGAGFSTGSPRRRAGLALTVVVSLTNAN